MWFVWVPAALAVLVLTVALFLIARRLRGEREGAARLDSRLAAVLESRATGLSVWNAEGRLVACNGRFREFYPGVQLKAGLVLEDLIRFTVTRGLVQVPEDQIETWVNDRMTRFREGACEVLRTADGRWLEIRTVPADHDEVLILYGDVTAVRDTEVALFDGSKRLEKHVADMVLLRRAIEVGGMSDSFESATQQLVDLVCDWSSWPVGHAYRVSRDDGDALETMPVWHVSTDHVFAPLQAVFEREPARQDDSVAGRALQSGHVVWIANVEVDPAISSERRGLMPGIRGVCAVPVKSRGRVVAVLEFLASEQLYPDPAAARLLEGVAEVLGWVVDRSRLTKAQSEST